ncbi:MAG TPA: tyrosine-type recombinase/integrase [Ktedonobacterales bacterium]|nr:tyrosine-type recombinase/integrase [Ktedonobacterales bacterium]
MEIVKAIEGFLIDWKLRRRAEGTVRVYRSHLMTLAQWLAEQEEGVSQVEDVSILHLRAFMVAQQNRPAGSINPRRPAAPDGHTLTASTLGAYVKAIKVFFGWLVEEEIIGRNPTLRLAKPAGGKRLRQSLPHKHVEALLNVCDTSTSLGFRNFVLTLMLLDTGLRVSELCGLRLDNVHEQYVKVLGKGKKEREVGISPATTQHLWKYIHQYRAAADEGIAALFTNVAGKRLTSSGVYQVVHRIREAAGVTDINVTPHTFRHTFSRVWLESGGDVMSLSRVLGHSSVKVTEIYLEDFQSRQARSQHAKFSPVNGLRIRQPRRGATRHRLLIEPSGDATES